MNRNRQQALIYLALAVIGIILLGVSLPDLRFQSGLPIPGAETTPQVNPAAAGGSPRSTFTFPWLLQGVLALGCLLLLIIFVIALLKKASKKRIGLAAAILLILVAVLAWLPRAAPALSTSFLDNPPAAGQGLHPYAIAPIGAPPPWLFFLVLAGLLLLAAAAGAWLLVMAFKPAQKENTLGREISEALQAIEGGQNLHSVIIRCYLRMESLVKDEQGVEREASVTPREFENHLAAKGIARTPIRQLTRLFEKARYGNQGPNPQDEQEAVDCLSAIQLSCSQPERGQR